MFLYDRTDNTIDIYEFLANFDDLKQYRKEQIEKILEDERILKARSRVANYGDSHLLENLQNNSIIPEEQLTKDGIKEFHYLDTVNNSELSELTLLKFFNGSYDDKKIFRIKKSNNDLDYLLLTIDIYNSTLDDANEAVMPNIIKLNKELYLLQMLQQGNYEIIQNEDIKKQLELYSLIYKKSVDLEEIKKLDSYKITDNLYDKIIKKAEIDKIIFNELRKDNKDLKKGILSKGEYLNQIYSTDKFDEAYELIKEYVKKYHNDNYKLVDEIFIDYLKKVYERNKDNNFYERVILVMVSYLSDSVLEYLLSNELDLDFYGNDTYGMPCYLVDSLALNIRSAKIMNIVLEKIKESGLSYFKHENICDSIDTCRMNIIAGNLEKSLKLYNSDDYSLVFSEGYTDDIIEGLDKNNEYFLDEYNGLADDNLLQILELLDAYRKRFTDNDIKQYLNNILYNSCVQNYD